VKQRDDVEPRGGGFGGSPDRRRNASYKKAADDVISSIQ
jgi:hypothetical protein